MQAVLRNYKIIHRENYYIRCKSSNKLAPSINKLKRAQLFINTCTLLSLTQTLVLTNNN